MAVFDWSNTVTTWHFNPTDVRDPTIVFNNTGNPVGSAPGYDGTQYDFAPKNFAPNISDGKAQYPAVWTQIPLDQFGVGNTAKEVILTGNCGLAGPDEWKGVIYMWFRLPGSIWDLSPIFDGGYDGSFCIHAPVGLITNAAGVQVPAIEMAWGVNNLNLAAGDSAWLNAILTAWGE